MVPIIDMHCDTFSIIYKSSFAVNDVPTGTTGVPPVASPVHIRRNERHVNLEDLKSAGYMCQSFAMFVNQATYKRYIADAFAYLCGFSECMDREIAANPDLIAYALTGSDIERNFREGKVSALKTVEDSFVYQGDLEKLRKAYDFGVRKSTLTWNYENELAYPNPGKDQPMDAFDTVNGLKTRGFEFVEAMEAMGMIIDISHLNDAGIRDVFKTVKSSTPIVASHSNARGVCNHKRNLSDAMIRQLADHGGVTGINFCPMFVNADTWTKPAPNDCWSRIDDLIRHMVYIRKVGGIDVLAMGSDLDGIGGKLEVNGCKELPKLIAAMDRAGFTDTEIEKVMYQNALRVYKDVLG